MKLLFKICADFDHHQNDQSENQVFVAVFCRWLVLDTDSKDLVTVHTDGSEQLSVLKYGPGTE